MAFKSFSKGYVLSSTPLQSPEDSGYFGSGQRRYKSNANVLSSSCSPVKESVHKNLSESPFQYEFCEISQQIEFDKKCVTKNESFSSTEINELSEVQCAGSHSNSQFCKISPFESKKEKFNDLLYNSYKDARNTRLSFGSLSEDSDIKYKLFDSSNLTNSDSKYFNNEFSIQNGECDIRSVSIFKQKKIDFIHELNSRNCFSIISLILSCLSAKELCIASCINKEWNKVILCDSKANTRRKNFISERVEFLSGPFKENRRGMKHGPAQEHKSAFTDITNLNVAHPVAAKTSNTKFDSFIKEGRNSRSKLLKCPQCCYASKKINGNNYRCTHCSYNFCSHCLGPVVINHYCFKREQLPNISKNDIIGSKKSRRNLKRL